MNHCFCLKSPLSSLKGNFKRVPTETENFVDDVDDSDAEHIHETHPKARTSNTSTSTSTSDTESQPPPTDTQIEPQAYRSTSKAIPIMPARHEAPLSGNGNGNGTTSQMLSEESQVALKDEIAMTPRHNPRMKLLASSSNISDFSQATEASKGSIDSNDSDWTTSGFPTPPTQVNKKGLMITLEEGKCQLRLVPDSNFEKIHPNVYAPSALENVRALYGGGSGVAVFGGHHPSLGDLVMKHGGYKDTQELFALATISMELKRRGRLLNQVDAAVHMQAQLPCFRMIYMSPNHIMARGKELVDILTNFVRSWSLTSVPSSSSLIQTSPKLRRASMIVLQKPPELEVGMKIRLYEGADEDGISVLLDTKSPSQSLSLILPEGSTHLLDSKSVQLKGDGYESLDNVVQELMPIMTQRAYKFTLAQKTIGGDNPKTGNQWLYEGRLNGVVLDNLLVQFIQVVKNLQALTLPEEEDVVQQIREELFMVEGNQFHRADQISDVADAFVGNAIRKNFHPEKGRQIFLKAICQQIREGDKVFLTPEEEIPALHLGILLETGATMNQSFVDSPEEPTTLQIHPQFWRNILRRAVDDRRSMSPAGQRCLWTCGLTDAGIHNLFVSETDLYLFDLGKPQLMSLPGFMTKFLFSFFHTLGMEDDGKGSWVRRFDIVGDKLALTQATQDLLPKAYDAFEESLNRVIDELLDGDRYMRWMLLEYITLQLLSDTAFCLQKWQLKGGGKPRDGNHQVNQEKWLWRALWDIYIAFDINTSASWTRFDIQHPQVRDSLFGRKHREDSSSLSSKLSMSIRMSGRLERDVLDALLRADNASEFSDDSTSDGEIPLHEEGEAYLYA